MRRQGQADQAAEARLELAESVANALRLLPGPLRAVFWMREAEARSYREMAVALSVSASTIKRRLQEARNLVGMPTRSKRDRNLSGQDAF